MANKEHKRGQNEGSIRERKDGKYEARYTVGRGYDGRQIQKSVYGQTRDEVRKKLTKALRELDIGSYVEPSRTTISEWLDNWLWNYKKQVLKPKTLDSYEQIIRLYLKPALGHVYLKDLRTDHVQKMINSMADEIPIRDKYRITNHESKLSKCRNHEEVAIIKKYIDLLKSKRLSQRTIEYTLRILHGSLEQALINDLIHRNVSSAVVLPKKQKKEISALSEEEQNQLMLYLTTIHNSTPILLVLFSGLRIGELLGLKWRDIDFKSKTLKIERTIQRIKTHSKTGPKTKVIENTPKTISGKRTIPLIEEVIVLLKKHLRVQKAGKLRLGEIYQDHDFVFPKNDGTVNDVENYTKEFTKIIAQSSIRRINFHLLRHTFATRGLERGIDLKVMQDLLGHSTFAMTADTYTHVLPQKKSADIEKLRDLATCFKC